MSDKPLLKKWRTLLHAAADQRLCGADLRVLVAVLDRMNNQMECWPGYGRISADTRVSRRTATRSIERLVGLGYLTKTSRGTCKSNLYRLCQLSVISSIDEGDTSDEGDTPLSTGMTPALSVNVTPEPNSLNLTNEPDSSNAHTERFDDFWTAYPRKEGKQRALKYWKRQKLDSEADRIIADVKARLADPGQWKGTKQKHIPHGSTYVNERRWEDEWQPEAGSGRLEREDPHEAQRANEQAVKEAEKLWQS